MEKKHRLLLILALLHAFTSAKSQSFIGVNYGQVADNLPPPDATARLLQSTTISKVRLYGADPGIIQALASTNISIIIGTANGDIPSLAADPSAASQWVSTNILPFFPASAIAVVSVGNEVLNSGDASLSSQLLPAMQNLQSALIATAPSIKISTVHSMAVLAQSDPPSSGAFHSDLAPDLNGVLGFLKQHGSPFMINPYPFFAYRDDPTPETLAFCLFQPNLGRLDAGSKITYTNMFDAQLDAIRSALNAEGFPEVEIVVAETGWPYRGDPTEAGTTVENAQAYNGNLVTHLRSMIGTPLMPGKSVDTYLFALYDEDLKPGPTSERSFGLFRTDLTMIYDAGFSESSSSQVSSSPPLATSSPAGCTSGRDTCPQPQQVANCDTTVPGSACYVSNAVGSHAVYDVNLVYRLLGRHLWDFDLYQQLGSYFSEPSQICREVTDTKAALCPTFGFSLSFLFYVGLPLLLLT